jgi:hypothetical protein
MPRAYLQLLMLMSTQLSFGCIAISTLFLFYLITTDTHQLHQPTVPHRQHIRKWASMQSYIDTALLPHLPHTMSSICSALFLSPTPDPLRTCRAHCDIFHTHFLLPHTPPPFSFCILQTSVSLPPVQLNCF